MSDLSHQLQADAEAEPAAPPDSDAPTLHGCPVDESSGAFVIHCNRDAYLELCGGLRSDGYAMPVGVTGVDYLTHPGRSLPDGIVAERFEVVVELLDLEARKRARVRCQVPESDPHVPTLFGIWPGVEAHERETFDMYGIRFEGHPDLRRIYMYEEFVGYPLRKDYPKEKRQPLVRRDDLPINPMKAEHK